MGILSDLLRTIWRGRDHGVRSRLRQWLRGASPRREEGRSEAPPPRPAPVVAVPPGFVVVARVGEVPPGGIAEVIVDGEPLALCNVAGTLYAVSATCPHAGGPLADGSLDGATLTCPLHGWTYDVRDGRCFVDAATRLPTREVTVVADAVCVRVTAEAPRV